MVYVYGAAAESYDSFGLCGPLTPTRCEHDEQAGGLSELTLEHPIDDLGRFSHLQPGAVLKAPVPVRTTPAISGGTVTSVERWRVKATASKAERTLFSKGSGGRALASLPANLELAVVKKSGERYQVKTAKYGSGWLNQSALQLVIQQSLPGDAGAIERVVPAAGVRDQLFRIYEAEQTDQGLVCRARHISYDLLGNLTSYKADQPTAAQALSGILDGCKLPHEFEAHTDMADKRTDVCFENVNPIKALLDPETGFLARWGAQLVRDDFELFFLRQAGLNRGLRVEYGKNLLGLSCAVSYDSAVSHVLPVGETSDGKPLYLQEALVPSPRASGYPTPRVLLLPVAGAKVSKSVSTELARKRLLEAAEAELAAGCDLPGVSLRVDFIRLGDCQGLEQLRDLESVFLYDTVSISHKPLGLNLSAQVVRMKFDCLRGRVMQVELGSARGGIVSGSIASWQIPGGISGGKILTGSISGGALSDDVISARHIASDTVEARHIQADAITAQHIQADALYAQKLVAAVSEIISANIQRASIGQAEIDWARVSDLNALVASVAKAQITEATISSAHIQWAQIGELSAAIAQIAQAEIARAQISEAAIEQANIRWAEIASLQAAVAQIAQATIGSADVGFARVKDLMSGTAIITEGVGGKLYIDRLAVTEANMVSLTVGELVIKKDDGRFYGLTVDADGRVVAQERPVSGQVLDEASVPGGKLIERSITARELNVEAIFADHALLNTIKAMHIDAADLFASSASFGKITANHLSADVGASLDLTSNQSIRQLVDKTYLELDADGVTIGANDSDGHYKVSIRPDRVAVLQDGAPIAYFQGNRLHTCDAEIEREIRLGQWVIGQDGDQSLSIYHL